MKAFGYTWPGEPPFDWYSQPATPKQKEALGKQRMWRKVTPQFWELVTRKILEAAGCAKAGKLNKYQASLLLDFWINAQPSSKRAAEQCVIDEQVGQQELGI